jgi:ribosome biogenesis GTPase A
MSDYQAIQWYPGHMFKTMKHIQNSLKMVDIVLFLLDARVPLSSLNPEILKQIKHKKILMIFNKKDLADLNQLVKFERAYEKAGFDTLSIDALSSQTTKKILQKIDLMMIKEHEKRISKGLKQKIYKVMVLGIPNSGKSTLINTLSTKKAAKTGNQPGVTKHLQWVRLSERLELLDTPGVLWPKFEDPKVGFHLALMGAIKDDILPLHDVVEYGVNWLVTHHPGLLEARYQIDESKPIIEQIARKRGAMLKGDEIDEMRTFTIFLNELRSAKIGKLVLDDLSDVSL